jgi:predicted dehydrogenase
MHEKLKCVIVGYGYMGEIRKQVIENHELLELVGICDPVSEKCGKIKGYSTFESFDELLATDPDIVFVCTPNRFAPEICVKSMGLGKHVFCEKPPGRNIDDIKRIIAAENEKIKLMFGFNHRFHPGIIKAKVIIDNGRLGKIISMRGIYGKSGGINYSKSWRNNKTISGGGILLDQGIHMLDLFRYFCGEFQNVKCFATNAYWDFNLEDNAMVILSNDKGQNAMLHSSATQWKHTFHITVILENGYLIVEGLLSKTGSYGREKLTVARRQFEDEADALGNPSEEITYFDRDLSWDLEVDEFVKCIIQDRPVTISNSKDALRVMEIITKAYKDADVDSIKERIQ